MKKIIQADIRIRTRASEIIDALVDADKLSNWWAAENVFIQPRDGGLYTLSWLKSVAGIKFIMTGRINLYNKRSHLYLEDMLYINSEKGIVGPTAIRFDTEEASEFTCLSITQTGFQKDRSWEWHYKLMADSWPQVLIFLKQYLEK